MKRSRIPVYRQQAPAGLYTREQLQTLGLRLMLGELPRALLKVCGADSEHTTGVFGLDQAEPLVSQAASA